ncbi:MAG: hypothetical protein Q9216_007057 [Gyalolechia sp. 2 TL-2023]
MHLLSIILAFLGSFLLVKAAEENTCTTTAVVSITTDVLTPRSTTAPEAESVTVVSSPGPIVTLPSPEAGATGVITASGPIGTHTFNLPAIPTPSASVPEVADEEATTTAAATAAATTGAQPASGAMATAVPAAKGANLALAVVAGVMLLL